MSVRFKLPLLTFIFNNEFSITWSKSFKPLQGKFNSTEYVNTVLVKELAILILYIKYITL